MPKTTTEFPGFQVGNRFGKEEMRAAPTRSPFHRGIRLYGRVFRDEPAVFDGIARS